MRGARSLLLGVALLAPGRHAGPAEPCVESAGPERLATLCGFAKPEDVEALAGRGDASDGWTGRERRALTPEVRELDVAFDAGGERIEATVWLPEAARRRLAAVS